MQEGKCLKTSVFINDTICREATEQAIDVDFTLPDYCPDITKIFKCQAVPRISSKGVNGKTVTIDGTVMLTVLYGDKEGNLCSYEYQYPFSKNIELPSEHTGVNIFCKTRIEYINCRAVTGRKIDIHGAVGIFLKAFKRKTTDIISDIDDNNTEIHRGIAPATVPMGYAEKYLLIEEELEIGQGQPAVKNIIRSEAKSLIRETKIINDKAVVKGEMTVCVMYCPVNSSVPQCVKTVLPFSQIVDIEGITDTCKCETNSEIAFFEVKPRVSPSGEIKTFSVTSKILLSLSAWCSNEIAVVLDAFSRKHDADIVRNKINFQKIIANISETYHCKKSVELETPAMNVLDLWCNVQTDSVKFEENNMIICGIIIASLIVSGEKEDTYYMEKNIDFEYKYPVLCDNATPYAEPEIEILSSGYTLTSTENMEIRVDLSINASVYETREISLISDYNIDENKQLKRKCKGAMVIYFPSENDSVWDIAKKYNASVEEIMRINELENDTIPNGKTILVPMV